MSLLTQVKQQMTKETEQTGEIEERLDNRAFVLGPALVDESDRAWGISSEDYAPREYGKYVSTSNAVYSILNERSNLLAALPLITYNFNNQIRSMLRGYTQEKRQQYRQDVRARLAKVAHLPRRFKRAIAKEGLEEVVEGDIYELLRHVNPYWTPSKLLKMTDMSLGLWGRCFWFLERGQNNIMPPQEIWWAKSPDVRVVPHPTDYVEKFIFDPVWTIEQDYLPKETIWFNYPHPLNEFQPLAPLASSRIYADHSGAAMLSNINLHKQGLQMGGVIWPANKKTWSEGIAKEIEADLHRRFAGASKAHRWAAFKHEIGMKESGITPHDAEFLEGMNWDLESVARSYNWPLDLIGGRRTYENVQAAMVAAYTFSVLPQASFIASELIEQLIPKYQFPGVDLIVFDSSEVAVLQEAESEMWDRTRSQIEVGAKTINEYRLEIGDEELPWGDIWWVQSSVVPAGSQSLQPEEDLESEFDEEFDDGEGVELERTLGEINSFLSEKVRGNGR
jgi:HK97 family phage portal protein